MFPNNPIDPMTGMPMNHGMMQERTGEYYSKINTDYTNVSSEKIPTFEINRKINKINLMAGRGPNLDSIQKVNPVATSGAIKDYYTGSKWKGDIKKTLRKSLINYQKKNKTNYNIVCKGVKYICNYIYNTNINQKINNYAKLRRNAKTCRS